MITKKWKAKEVCYAEQYYDHKKKEWVKVFYPNKKYYIKESQ